MADRVSLSLSLVDPDHTGTWGPVGLILDVPPSNVLITASSDVGSSGNDVSQLKAQAKKYGQPMSGDTLLAHSGVSYNEVVALATRGGNSVRLVGFFYKVTEDEAVLDEGLTAQMRIHAQRLGLPLVSMVEKSFVFEDEIESSDQLMRLRINQQSYLLYYEGNPEFMRYDKSHKSRFMTPDDMNIVVEHLRAKKYSATEIERLIQAYKQADQDRQMPEVFFDENGSLLSIVQRVGYGDGEERLEITSSGYSSRTNLKAERDQISVMAVSGKSASFVDTHYRPSVSLSEAERMITKLMEDDSRSEVEKRRIREWFVSISHQLKPAVRDEAVKYVVSKI